MQPLKVVVDRRAFSTEKRLRVLSARVHSAWHSNSRVFFLMSFFTLLHFDGKFQFSVFQGQNASLKNSRLSDWIRPTRFQKWLFYTL